MLENFANRFNHIVVISLVALISIAFVANFGGPQAQGCTGGGNPSAAEVDGDSITTGEVRSVYNAFNFSRRPIEEQRREQLWSTVVDGLVERTLLADEARSLGYRVSEEDVMKELTRDGVFRLSLGVESSQPSGRINIREQLQNREGEFEIERVRNFIQSMQRTVGEFTTSQVEEALADRMRQTIVSTVAVSPAEVWDEFARRNDKAKIEYVRYSPAAYRDSIQLSDAEVQAWMAANADSVTARYTERRAEFTDLPEQVRVRHIAVEVEATASEADRAAARAEATSLLQQVRGGADFATLAREHSDDEGSKGRGGDMGFRRRGMDAPSFEEAIFALNPGQTSDLIETPTGFHIARVEAKRQGTVAEAEAKLEIATEMARDERAQGLARDAAVAGLAALRAGGTPEAMEAIFDAQAPAGAPESLRPSLSESRLFGRGENPITGPFQSVNLVKDVFARSMDHAIPDAPIALGEEFVIYRLIERQNPDREQFTATEQDTIRRGLLYAKQQDVLTAHVLALRERAERDGRIEIRMLPLTTTVEGRGEITSDPAGIACGSSCEHSFEFGQIVLLTAEPSSGSRFESWTGACAGSGTQCIVTLDEARTVGAQFRTAGSSAPSSME